MSSDPCAVPAGVIPYLVVPDSVAAMQFYSTAFGAVEIMRMPGPGGQGTMHAEMDVYAGRIMLTDENPQWDMKSALALGGSPISLMIYVSDVDQVFQKAVAGGCEAMFPPTDMFWGDRMCKVRDPFGYQWSLATHVEDVPPEEMAVRQEKWLEECAPPTDSAPATETT